MREARPLTSGEIELAHSMFGDAVDYRRCMLVRGKWWPLQSRGIVMAPTGNIHFHPDSPDWRDDFATAPLSLQGLFIHEMTHVLQTQQRGKYYLPFMRHPFCRYNYRFLPGRPFGRYGLEQQAEIVRHVFLMRRNPGLIAGRSLAELEATLPFHRHDASA